MRPRITQVEVASSSDLNLGSPWGRKQGRVGTLLGLERPCSSTPAAEARGINTTRSKFAKRGMGPQLFLESARHCGSYRLDELVADHLLVPPVRKRGKEDQTPVQKVPPRR